jgi:hypothetical protein
MLAPSPDEPGTVAARVAAALGRDPFLDLSPEILRAYRHLGPSGAPESVRRALDEELTRHAALAARAAEIREAAAEMAEHPDESLTVRVRTAAEAEHAANTEPLQDDESAEESERLEFASIVRVAKPHRPRKG